MDKLQFLVLIVYNINVDFWDTVYKLAKVDGQTSIFASIVTLKFSSPPVDYTLRTCDDRRAII